MQFTKVFRAISFLLVSSLIFPPDVLFAQSAQTLSANQLVLPSKDFVIRFSWLGDSVQARWEPNTAMLIPVRIKNCPRRFYMQFDLGSPYSVLYKNKLEAIRLKYPAAVTSSIHEKLYNFSFVADETPLLAKKIIVQQFDSASIDRTDSNGIEIIGTIGADLIDGRVAIIDYPGCRLSISQKIPEKIKQRLSLTDFVYANRRVLLPAKIKESQTMLYFDTGSSMFELLSDEATCNKLSANGTKITRFSVKSWNKALVANMLAVNENIELANMLLPLRSCAYIEGVSDAQVEYMSKLGIGGMVGNKLFLNCILVLDTQHKKFGIAASLK